MSEPRQQTTAKEVLLAGTGLHTGDEAELRFIPSATDTGIRFRRVDLEGRPEVLVDLDHVESTDRGTTLGAGEARVHTVEHVLAAVGALEIDNLVIEISGPEVPIADGSFQPFLSALSEAGLKGQDEPARVITVRQPLSVHGPRGGSYTCTSSKNLRIAATIEFEHPMVRRQFASFDITPESFCSEIGPARTFGFLREAEELRARGLALGATLDNAIVLDEEGLASDGELRFGDEFVRHKIGDVVGDLTLTGARVRAHVVAERPSHAGNLALARQILAARARESGPVADARRILECLPHRYPLLLVDRILELESGKRVVGLKNVTLNEPFFQGHFPGHPVMPGVLIIEAMAQVGGLMLMDAVEDPGNKVPYFAAADNVKWRRPVTPGDQLRITVEMLQLRRNVCRMKGVATVDGDVVAEAEMLAQMVDR